MDLNDDSLFRGAVALVYLGGWVFVRFYFQWKLGAIERVQRKHEGREKLAYVMVSLSAVPVLLYVLTPWLRFSQTNLPEALRWAGCGLGFAGSSLLIWTHSVLGRNWSGVLEIAKDHELIKEGPYRVVRHPMYSAFFLMSFGLLLLSANWIVGVFLLGSVSFMYLMRVTDEERMMVEQFGSAYERYMNDTGRLMPRLRL